ncbi:hypothetical protein CDL15_Pgr024612 [Punica granatum]|uniref:Uncharacterized protein n=1 Tax=Punica granatum TaxID=22663 RepID=A0A218W8S4_PUNGR|nr:hypothetical protein CDL15_Pgr024612 [Punica granatum]
MLPKVLLCQDLDSYFDITGYVQLIKMIFWWVDHDVMWFKFHVLVDPILQTFDLAINNFESDLNARYLISVLEDQTKLHLYYEYGQVDDPLKLNEEKIRELERVEDERREQEAELKRKQEEIERMEQEAAEEKRQEVAEKRRQEEEMERMRPQEMKSGNANVEASQVRTNKKSVAVKKRKQKEKEMVADDYADAIHASLASPPAIVGDDVEDIPMDVKLSDGYESEDLESLVPQMDTFAEASFLQPMTAPAVRPLPVRIPPVRPPHTFITAHTMEVASSGTAARFSAYFQPMGPPPN